MMQKTFKQTIYKTAKQNNTKYYFNIFAIHCKLLTMSCKCANQMVFKSNLLLRVIKNM